VIALDAAAQHPLISTAALLALVYITCVGAVLATQMAWRGHPAYWLTSVGALLFMLGAVWARGYLGGGVTFALASLGVVAAVFGVALDLIFGPPLRSTPGE
jgi:hypothetical protein